MDKHYDKELSTKTVRDLIAMQEDLVPPYMTSAWKEIPQKYTLERFRAIAEIMLALSKNNEWKATRILLDEWIDDGSVLGAIAHLSYEGAKVVRKVLTIKSGDLSKQNKTYLDNECQVHETKAYNYYKKAAYAGDSKAQFQYARLLEYGIGVEQNKAEAILWYYTSAKNNNVNALCRLGVAFYCGDLLDQDYTKAVYYFTQAANHGDGVSQCILGYCYEYGEGVSQSISDAIRWYKLSIKNGCALGFKCLGDCYLSGNGVRENKEKAFSLFCEGAKRGDEFSQSRLGVCYREGFGVDKDIAESVFWLKESAEAGEPIAQYFLGLCYSDGDGTEKDYNKAYSLYLKSASKGYSRAQFEVGLCNEKGLGTDKNLEQAIHYYTLAASQENRDAKVALDRIKEERVINPNNIFSAEDDTISELRELEEELKLQLELELGGGKNTRSHSISGNLDVDSLFENEYDNINSAESKSDSITVEELFDELNSMIGLADVKKELKNRINIIRLQQQANALGSKRVFSHGSLHMVFTGNSGTGKTTVARLIGKIYGKLGVIKNGDRFIECSRDDLTSKYIGETAIKVREKMEEARGGILYIDEAYALYNPDSENDFGKEAIDTLVQCMDSMRDELVIILAGYRNKMVEFIRNANPGLASRFRTTIDFKDYTPSEMVQIFVSIAAENGFTLDKDTYALLLHLITERSKQPGFGNARGVRNLFEDVVETHDSKLAEKASHGVKISIYDFEHILAADIKELLSAQHDELLDVTSLLAQLDSMVGLHSVKRQLRAQVAVVQTHIQAERAGVKNLAPIGPQHMIFAGNPGTGKTTIARLLGRIYQSLGIIVDSNIFVECGRSDLVGRYIGQTAPMVRAKVQEALGGILFIDEAYSLYQGHSFGNDFGPEAISTLVQEMENHRDNLLVIMAGYPDKMKEMIQNANPGLASRFPIWINFEDYTVSEMKQIFIMDLHDKGYSLSERAETLLPNIITKYSQDERFGNARGVRNLVDKAIYAQGSRLASAGYKNIGGIDYVTITDEDISELMH